MCVVSVVVGASLFLVAAVSLCRLWRRRVDTSENRTTNTTGFTKHFVVNEHTGEYLGESEYQYHDVPNTHWVLSTDWASQPDKTEKFQWAVVANLAQRPGIGQASDYQIMSLATGHGLKDSNVIFNDKGDYCVTASLDSMTTSSRWLIVEEDRGSFLIRNLFTGRLLGASKKFFNNRGDHHIMSSPTGQDETNWKKWRWQFATLE